MKSSSDSRRATRAFLMSTAVMVLLGSGVAVADSAPPPLPGSALKAIQTKEAPAAATSPETETQTETQAEPAAPVEQAVPVVAAPEASETQPEAAEAAVSEPEAVVPAERAAAADESARLASEVPAEDVAIPAAEWLNQEVGSIATRPVAEGATQAEPIATGEAKPSQAEPVQAEPAQVEPVQKIETTVVETAPIHKPVDMKIGDPMIKGESKKDEAVAAADAPAAETVDEKVAGEAEPQPVAATPTVVRIESPKIVTIEADYRKPEDKAEAADTFEMKGPAAIEASSEGAPVATGGKFALVWIDGSQRSGDTFVKFYKPVRQFFESGNACLSWARDKAAEGLAISPEGVQPGRQALSAGCLARDGSREYWIWRQGSGAFTKSQLSPAQFALFEDVVRQWSASSKLAYGEFPVPPYAGQ